MEEESAPLRRRTKRDRSVARECDADLVVNMEKAKGDVLANFPQAQFSDTYVEAKRATCVVTDIDCEYSELHDVRIWPAQLNINNGSLQIEVGPVRTVKTNIYYKIGVIWALFLLVSCLIGYWILQNYNADKLW